ncbi:hypothetical protein [Rosistilla oblonga]|uniref:hypothetical protein n=1 Tax=Rosistilla oblonga TaxID=2527990 RepID=UPI003A971F3B
MNLPIVEVLSVAAAKVVGGTRQPPPLSCATWNKTRHDDEFEPSSAIRYLRSEHIDVDESLLHAYFDTHRQHESASLVGITDVAPWMDCLDNSFHDRQSFTPLREKSRYSQIFTFSTPAWSDDGTLAFFEVWTESGRLAQMGVWWWVQMRLRDSSWVLDWKNMHSISWNVDKPSDAAKSWKRHF